MNKKYTPGPWLVGYGDAVGIGEVFGVGLDTEPDWTPVCMLSLSENVNELDEANASLIAAAPDLLESLVHLVDGIESCGLTGVYLDQARAAIAKATGGAS